MISLNSFSRRFAACGEVDSASTQEVLFAGGGISKLSVSDRARCGGALIEGIKLGLLK